MPPPPPHSSTRSSSRSSIDGVRGRETDPDARKKREREKRPAASEWMNGIWEEKGVHMHTHGHCSLYGCMAVWQEGRKALGRYKSDLYSRPKSRSTTATHDLFLFLSRDCLEVYFLTGAFAFSVTATGCMGRPRPG
jgi:hypothetical protein